MSVLTKVFVVLLTVLSISLSMFVVAAFSQQQKWKASASDWQQAALAAQAKERAVTANAALERQRALDRNREATFEIGQLREGLNSKEDDLATLSVEKADLQSKLSVEQGQVTSGVELSSLIQSALDREQQLSVKLSRRNSELERRNIDLNDRVKELTATLAMAKSRYRALKEQIASMTGDRVAGATQIPGGPGIVEPYTPTVTDAAIPSGMTSPIRAEVTSVRGNVVSISAGSAAGVAHGMTFLLYRSSGGTSKPQYVGTLRITRVEANQAAGMIEDATGDVRTGDQARDEASLALRG